MCRKKGILTRATNVMTTETPFQVVTCLYGLPLDSYTINEQAQYVYLIRRLLEE